MRNTFTFDPGEPPEGTAPKADQPEDHEEPVYDYDPDGEIAQEVDEAIRQEQLDEEAGEQESPVEGGDAPSVTHRRPLVPPMNMNMDPKFRRRRLIALAALCLVVLIPLAVVISKAVKNGRPVTTQNVGPLPSDEVVIHRVPVYYDYSAAVPLSDENTSFFSDALIVGDTRLVQLLPTYNIGTFGTVLYGSAINVSNALNYDSVDGTGAAMTLQAALAAKSYGKIYLCLGLNELGWSYPDVFDEDYRTLLDDIRRIQPDASIYLLSLVPVSESQYNNDYVNNTRMKQYNEIIRAIASEYRVYYVDCFAGMSDATGQLDPSYTSNGFYITQTGAAAWWKYLATHTVNPEDYEN